jgi:OOP family OmpA-OmpF porin
MAQGSDDYLMKSLMKNRTLALAGACGSALLLSTLFTHAQSTGFYFRGDVGGNITQDIDLKEFFGPVAPGSKIKLDPGFRAGLHGGYEFCEWFAAEAELGFMANEIKAITDATRVHDATFSNVPFLVNARFQFPTRCPFTPYIGAGVGFSETIFDVGTVELNNTHMHGSDSDAVFAYQGFAGLRYALNDRMGLSLEYRYFAADGGEWNADFAFNTPSDRLRFGRSQTHAFSIAFDFRF